MKGVVAETGKEVYSRDGNVDDISVGPDGTVYLSENGDLIAMNPELTEVKWRLRFGSAVTHHACSIVKDRSSHRSKTDA